MLVKGGKLRLWFLGIDGIGVVAASALGESQLLMNGGNVKRLRAAPLP